MKKSNLKKFLATASAVALISVANNSIAVTRNTAGSPVLVGGANTNLAAPFVNNDDIAVANAGHNVINTGANIVFGAANTGIDVGVNNGITFNISNNVTLAGANDFGTANNGLAHIIVQGGVSNFGQDVSGNVTVQNGQITIRRDIVAGGGNLGDLLVNNGVVQLNDAPSVVGINGGDLTMNDANAAGGAGNQGVVANGGTVTVNDIASDLAIANAAIVTQTGTTTGNLTVANAGQYLGHANTGDVTGTVNINTTNANMNTMHDAGNTVDLVAGDLTMNDAAGIVTVTAGNLIMNDANAAGGAGNQGVVANGGTVTVNDIASDLAIANAAIVTQTGTTTGNLTVANAGQYLGHANTGDVTGTVNINTTNANMNTMHDAGNTVDLVAGDLTMNDAAGIVTVTAGNLIMNDANAAGGAGNQGVVANGGTVTVNDIASDLAIANAAIVTQTGTTTGNLTVANAGQYLGHANTGDVTGTVNINTTNANMNTLHNATANVTLTAGNLTMNDALSDVTVTTGTFVANDLTGAGVGNGDLTVNGGTATVRNVARNVAVNNGANLTVSGNVGGNIDGNNNSTITLGDGTTTGNVANGQNIVVTGDRTFAGTWAATNLQVDGDNTLKFTNGAADIGGTNISTTATNKEQNFEVAHNQIITGNWGRAANPLGNLHVTDAAGKDITINTGESHISVTTAQADTTNVIFNHAAGGELRSIGGNRVRVNETRFTENGRVLGGTNSKTINVAAGKKAILGGKIKGLTLDLNGAGSALDLENDFTLDTAITAGTQGKGIVEFLGGGTVDAGKTIGTEGGNRVRRVTFSDDATKTLTFGSSVFANENIDIRKGTFKAENNNVVLNARDVNAINASFDLGSSGKITVNGGNLTFSGEKGKIAVKIAQSGNSGGQIIAGTGATLKYEADSKVTITPDYSGSVNRPAAGETSEFTIIKNDTGKDVIGTLNVALNEAKNSFTKWSSRFENGTLILTQKDAAADKIKEILEKRLDAPDKENIDALTQAAPGTDAHNFVNILADIARNQEGNLSDSDIKEKVDEAYNRLISTTAATDLIENTMNNAANSIGTRLSLVSNQTIGTPVQSRAVASTKVTGIAAGDDHARYGAWFSPFFSKTTQKARKGASGYKDSTYGGSFGMDTKANDDLIIGGAMTFANSETKYKNLKSGDKTKVNSLMFSIYALQQITDTWFAQGSATIASNEVKNSIKKVSGGTAYELASSKYNAMSFVGDVLFGYNYITEGFSLTPMGGVRYTRVNSAGYKESGSKHQSLDVSQKASNRFEVIVGGRVSSGAFDVNGMSVTPELHGFINHDIIGKTPKQDLRIGGVANSLNAKSVKPINTSYNLGVGVTANYGMMEYGAGYDVHLADKRVGHEGSLKVRVNF